MISDKYRIAGYFNIKSESENSLRILFEDQTLTFSVDKAKGLLVILSDRISKFEEVASGAGMRGYFAQYGYQDVPAQEEATLTIKHIEGFRWATIPRIFDVKKTYRNQVPDEPTEYAWLRDRISKLCSRNGLEYRFFGDLDLELKFLTLPLCRLTGKPTKYHTHSGLMVKDDIYNCGDLDEVTKHIFGISTPKLKRIVIQKLFKTDYQVGGLSDDSYMPKDTISEALRLGYNGNLSAFCKRIETFSIDTDFVGFCDVMTRAFGVDKAFNIIEPVYNNRMVVMDIPTDRHRETFFEFIKEMGYHYVKKLVTIEGYLDSSFYDTIWMWERYRKGKIPQKLLDKGFEPLEIPRKCKSFHEMHDRMVKPYSEMKAIDDFQVLQFAKLKKHKPLKKLNKSVYNGYTIVFPENTRDFVTWGREMSNCISSYFDRVQRDETMVFSLVKDGKICFNIECTLGYDDSLIGQKMTAENKKKEKFKIKQFMAYSNQAQSVGDRIKLEKFINTMV